MRIRILGEVTQVIQYDFYQFSLFFIITIINLLILKFDENKLLAKVKGTFHRELKKEGIVVKSSL